jgi:hypothetical protein
MKKFGTPSGAAPGWAKENVGFAALGTPFAAGMFDAEFLFPVPLPLFLSAFFLPLFLLPLFLLLLCLFGAGFLAWAGVVVVPGWLCAEVVCFFPGRVGCGAVWVDVVEVDVEVVVELDFEVEVEVEVEVGLEVEVEVEVEVGLEVEVEVEVAVVVGLGVEVELLVVELVEGESVVVVVVWVGHETPTTVPPAGTGTGLVAVGIVTWMSPVGRWTVAMQSASAAGIMAIAWTASTVITVASPTVSFRLLNTLAYLLPPPSVRNLATPLPSRGANRKLPIGIGVCNAEPFDGGVVDTQPYGRQRGEVSERTPFGSAG